MAEYDTDAAREFRRARILKIRPLAADVCMDGLTYRSQYVRHHVVSRVYMADAEQKGQVMFCPACQVNFGPDMVKARRLHVSYEQDVMGNYAMLATVRCRGCSWEEIIPVILPTLTEEESMWRARGKQAAYASLYGSGGSGGMSQYQSATAMQQQQMLAGMAQANGLNGGIVQSMLGRPPAPSINPPMPRMHPGMWSNELMEVLEKRVAEPGGGTLAFGQSIANGVWQRLSVVEQEQREAQNAIIQAKMIERVEKDSAAKQTISVKAPPDPRAKPPTRSIGELEKELSRMERLKRYFK